ncbi:O-antigen ligase family protein [Cryptosporangium minutisporangium]|uniref:O-antigen ligase-related domain-containing protein n=1 Tax=Cryptosporangium minutisporangium TaxID=113569 RepID=A0ABP6SRI7_9ACTN
MTGLASARGVGASIGAVVVAAAAVVEYVRTDHLGEAAEASVAALLAVAVVWLAVTLPGSTPRGAAIGGAFVLAGILTWTSTDRPIVIWGALAIAGLAFAVWGRPWISGLRSLPGLGAAWTGLSYWLLGIVGALLVGHLTVGVQRLAYAGVFTLAALAVVAFVRSTGRDPSVGVAAAVLVGIAALLLAGSGSVFDTVREAPAGSGQLMRDRFWGGLDLFYHPNSLAGLGVVAAIRIGLDRAFATWQRLAVTGLAGLLLTLSDSRTGIVFAAAAALLHAVLVLRRRRPDLPDYRRRWAAMATPFVILALVLVFTGGYVNLTRDRLNTAATPNSTRIDAATSGRTDTWRQVLTDWQDAGVAEKLFGDATTSRAVVTRTDDGAPVDGPRRQLNTDNAAVGAFRRGGVLGAVAFLVGVGLLVAHAVRRRRDGTAPAAWFTVAVAAILPTIATEDWVLGGTNGAIWILLLAGEAFLVARGQPTTRWRGWERSTTRRSSAAAVASSAGS